LILITGAAGFIGSVLVSELNKRGITELILVDHFRDGGKWLNLRGLKFADFISVEDFEAQDLWKTYTRLKAIYHMGACSATTEKNMDFLYKNNFQFSRKLFELAGYGNIPFIYASSAATYGEGELGYNDDHGTIPKLRPLNPYGYSKQLFDEWVLNYKNKPEVWYGLKFFNVFGQMSITKARCLQWCLRLLSKFKKRAVFNFLNLTDLTLSTVANSAILSTSWMW
jgi:ADP-L-glycero-D-manno-heptose 6-epimerase